MSTKQLQTAAYEDGKACFHAGTPFSYGDKLFKSISLRMEWENGWAEAKRSTDTLAGFAAFLRETLIPDLRADGMDATASDFEEALKWIGKLDILARGLRSACRRALPHCPPDSDAVYVGEWIDEANEMLKP